MNITNKIIFLLCILLFISIKPNLPTEVIAEIKDLVKVNKLQLSFNEYQTIAKTIYRKTPCNLLIFGVGKDSSLWKNLNKEGLTIFIEDNKKWLDLVKTNIPDIKAYFFNYHTVCRDWEKLLKSDHQKTLTMNLPKEISTTKWDIIFVDAPAGYSPQVPGRMKSIYTSSVFAHNNKNVDIFVHDCNRIIERIYCDTFFASNTLVEKLDKLRHYLIN